MGDLIQKIKMPLIILAVVVGLFIVYNGFIKKDESDAVLKKPTAVAAPDKDFLPLLLRIQNVTLDEELFLDPVFRGLSDLGQIIVPESIGKQNPFGAAVSTGVSSSVEGLGFREDRTATTTAR